MISGRLKNSKIESLSTLLTFGFIYLYLLYIFKPSLIFLNTTIAGGDTGSHNYLFYHLKRTFPSIHSWSQDWYYGFPFLYFYPPLLYILALFLSYFIPDHVAFKVITLLGTFLLPLTTYLSLRIITRDRLIPLLGTLISPFFLFLEQYSIYGGNIPSTLAGEFSCSFSFSLFWLFMALIKRGLEEKRHLLSNVLLLSLVVLSHPIPVMFSLSVMPYFLIPDYKKNLFYIFKVYLFAFLLTLWWSLPFLLYFPYASTEAWTRLLKLSDVFPPLLIPLQIFSFLAIIYGFLKKDENIQFLFFIALTSLLIYLLTDQSKVWNTRFLPFFTFSTLLLSAYFLGILLRKIKFAFLLILLLTPLSLYHIHSRLQYIPSWVVWNYEGFERKGPWPELKSILDYLKGLPYGRVMWEYTPEYDRFGTPRVLELIPMFSEKPTIEGLLIESALSAPFHFILQAETTLTPTGPNYGFRYPPFDMKKAVEHMRFMGIRYFLAYTEAVKKEADKVLPILASNGRFTIYEVPEVRLIEPLSDFEVQKKGKNWKERAINWFLKGDLSKPIIFSDEEIKSPETKPLKCVLLRFDHNVISFYTEGIGIPHLVKVSYFPRWKVEGGRGPYLASPSFMVVIPERNLVRLRFD